MKGIWANALIFNCLAIYSFCILLAIMIDFYGLHESASLRHNVIERSEWKSRSSYFIFYSLSAVDYLLRCCSFAHLLAGHLLMAKNPYGNIRNFSFVCVVPSPYDHIARTHSVCVGYLFFIMMIDRSIKSSEVLLFAHHHSAYSISNPYSHAHINAFSFSHMACIVYHWAQLNGFTLQFSRKKK